MLRHNAKADPAGSCPAASGLGLPPVSTAGHMAVVAAEPRPFLSRVPRGHIPAKSMSGHSLKKAIEQATAADGQYNKAGR